jgi:large subunit ribosomal protein L18
MAHILKTKEDLRKRRHKRVRGTVSGTAERPRLAVFRSNTAIYAQVIDDVAGNTLASASSLKQKGSSLEKAQAVGKAVAVAAKAKGISKVVYDRGGFKYAGSILALAESAREAGLEF